LLLPAAVAAFAQGLIDKMGSLPAWDFFVPQIFLQSLAAAVAAFPGKSDPQKLRRKA